MSAYELDLYIELIVRVVFFVGLWASFIKQIEHGRIERNLFFGTFVMFIFAKYIMHQASDPSNEDVKDFFIIIGAFLNCAGYFCLFVLLQSLFKISAKKPFK